MKDARDDAFESACVEVLMNYGKFRGYEVSAAAVSRCPVDSSNKTNITETHLLSRGEGIPSVGMVESQGIDAPGIPPSAGSDNSIMEGDAMVKVESCQEQIDAKLLISKIRSPLSTTGRPVEFPNVGRSTLLSSDASRPRILGLTSSTSTPSDVSFGDICFVSTILGDACKSAQGRLDGVLGRDSANSICAFLHALLEHCDKLVLSKYPDCSVEFQERFIHKLPLTSVSSDCKCSQFRHLTNGPTNIKNRYSISTDCLEYLCGFLKARVKGRPPNLVILVTSLLEKVALHFCRDCSADSFAVPDKPKSSGPKKICPTSPARLPCSPSASGRCPMYNTISLLNIPKPELTFGSFSRRGNFIFAGLSDNSVRIFNNDLMVKCNAELSGEDDSPRDGHEKSFDLINDRPDLSSAESGFVGRRRKRGLLSTPCGVRARMVGKCCDKSDHTADDHDCVDVGRVCDTLDGAGRRKQRDSPLHVAKCNCKPSSILRGHSDTVHDCQTNLDERFVLSCSEDATVRLWETGGGHDRHRPLVVYRGHTRAVYGMALMEGSDQFFASCSADATVRLFEFERTYPLRILAAHASSVNSVAFSSLNCSRGPLSGSGYPLLASGSSDGTVRLWDLRMAMVVRVFSGLGELKRGEGSTLASGKGISSKWDRPVSVKFGPYGSEILALTNEGCLYGWDIGSGKWVFKSNPIRCHRSRTGRAMQLCRASELHTDFVVTCGSDDCSVRILNCSQLLNSSEDVAPIILPESMANAAASLNSDEMSSCNQPNLPNTGVNLTAQKRIFDSKNASICDRTDKLTHKVGGKSVINFVADCILWENTGSRHRLRTGIIGLTV